MFRKKFSLGLAAIFGTLTVLNPTPASALTEPNACNGVIEICSKPFDQVVLPGTHNSMSNQEYHWASPNQAVSIPNQLSQGIRAFLIDTYYGEVYVNGGIITVAKNQGHADGNTMYLCHGKCELGATELIPELAQVADFLAAHPREVLAFVVEDHIHPDDFAAAVTATDDTGGVFTVQPGQWLQSLGTDPSGAPVIVLNGREKGRTGEVFEVRPDENRALVRGVNLVKRHQKQSAQQEGGIISKEAPIHLSNLAYVGKDGKPTRVGFKFIGEGENRKKVRVAKRSGETIDA